MCIKNKMRKQIYESEMDIKSKMKLGRRYTSQKIDI